MDIGITSVILIILIIGSVILLYQYWKLRGSYQNLVEEYEQSEENYSSLLSQKKSSEVRLGLISEKLAPFLTDFDYEPKGLIFLGRPIDYIHFGQDEITFIEVKSGESKLSKKQRRIRDMVNNNNINWDIYRVN